MRSLPVRCFAPQGNNLYGKALAGPLPTGEFRWEAPQDGVKLLENYSTLSPRGYLMQVDLEYPAELHERDAMLPLAPESCRINGQPYLVAHWRTRIDYVVHVHALKFYIERGLKVAKWGRILSFAQSPWAKPYILI